MRQLLAAVLLTAVTACTGSDPAPPTPGPVPDVDLKGQWALTSAEIRGQAFDTSVDWDLTLVVFEGGGQAHAGCQVVWLDPQVSGESVALREFDKGSMLSCPLGTEQTDLDAPYLRAVAAVEHAERSDDVLTLTGPAVTLTFARTGSS